MTPNIRQTLKTVSLIAALGGFSVETYAQTNVWQDDFDQQPIGANSDDGSYGAVSWNFSGAGYGHPYVLITNDLPDTLDGYTGTNNCAFIFTTDPSVWPNTLNFGLRINRIPANGNTNLSLRSYTLNFDMAVSGGTSINGIGGYVAPQVGIFGGDNGALYNGSQGGVTNIGAGAFPVVGTGYQHFSVPLITFIASAGDSLLVPTNTPLSFYMGFYLAGHSYAGDVEIDLANISITMSNPPPPPPPIMTVVPASQPGLRVFAQASDFPYNQEGFGTVDPNQSWVGVATPANPVSYSVTFADFDTVNGYTCFVQFVQNGNPGDPFGVYNSQNALVWSITHPAPGGVFTTAVNWKTNAPASGQPNNALSLTTGSTNGRGTWTLTFTNDTDGTVTAPDGSSGSFSLDPTVTPNFANPCIIDFGSCPNWNTAGYGQWITYSKIAISNVVDGTEFDDFTQDASLNTSLWNPQFSYNNPPYGVVQVPPGNNYWVYWSLPADGFGVATKASLNGGTNVWFSPNYYGNGLFTNTPPTVMGGATNWTLIPEGCLPTVDGTQGGTPSPNGFFRLSNPPPAE
jgi:hypothetical protein